MWRGFLASWRLRSVAAVLLSIPIVFFGSALWRASRVAKQSAADVATRGKAAFQSIALGSSSTQFEPVSASPGFRDITNFQGSVVISAQAGLFVYDANGSLKQRYRSGIELPSAPLGMLSAGVAAGGSGPVSTLR